MILTSLQLQNFRSYKKRSFAFDEATTLIIGNNGAGKSNLLEAVFLLATGKSFRARLDEEMILYGQNWGWATGLVDEDKLAVFLSRPKRFFVNDVGKRRMDFAGNLRCVLFRPEDIDLVLGSPSLRREYLDFVLEQADREYRRSNLSFQKGLRQRNKLLERIRDGEADRHQLIFWDQLLVREGEIISRKREEFLEFVNLKLQGRALKLNYEPSRISPARLEQYKDNEVAAGKTLVGPHRDEFRFIVQRQGKLAKDLAIYGSRGEQRMAVFKVKQAELDYLGNAILLLDDIFSELDHEHREEIFKLLGRQQTIITTSDEHLVPKRYATVNEKLRL
jgi:DNA replication and repair protein RecF